MILVDFSEVRHHYEKGEFTLAYDRLYRLMEEGVDNPDDTIWVMAWRARLMITLGDLDGALSAAEMVIQLSQDFGSESSYIEGVLSKIDVLLRSGNVKEAMTLVEEIQPLIARKSRELENGSSLEELLARYFRLHGNLLSYLGRYDEGAKLYEQGFSILKESQKFRYERWALLNNLGNYHYVKGHLDQAEQYLTKAIRDAKEVGNEVAVAFSSMNLGRVFQAKGDLRQAYDIFLGIRALLTRMPRYLFESVVLFYLIQVAIEIGDLDRLPEYLSDLERIAGREGVSDDELALLYMGRALYELHKGRLSSIARAQEYLRAVDSLRVSQLRWSDAKLLELAILLQEALIIRNDEILLEIEGILNRLEEHARENFLDALLAELYPLRAQLELLRGNWEQARRFFLMGWDIAHQQKLGFLAKKISSMYENAWELASNIDPNSFSSSHNKETLKLMSDSVHSLIFKSSMARQEQEWERPVFFLIMQDTGIMVFSRTYFEGFDDKSLIGGFLATVNMFASEVFVEKGSIQIMKYENWNVMMKRTDKLIFAYAFQGPSFRSRAIIDGVIEKVYSSPELLEYLEKQIFKKSDEKETSIKLILDELVFSFGLDYPRT